MQLTNTTYWRDHYLVETNAAEVAEHLRPLTFVSGGKAFELVAFERGPTNPGILISPGSAGHAYIFAELAYLMSRRGYNVFIMPRHGGFTIRQLMARHEDALLFIAERCNDRIGVFAEGLGGWPAFYLALAGGLSGASPCKTRRACQGKASFRACLRRGASDG